MNCWFHFRAHNWSDLVEVKAPEWLPCCFRPLIRTCLSCGKMEAELACNHVHMSRDLQE